MEDEAEGRGSLVGDRWSLTEGRAELTVDWGRRGPGIVGRWPEKALDHRPLTMDRRQLTGGRR